MPFGALGRNSARNDGSAVRPLKLPGLRFAAQAPNESKSGYATLHPVDTGAAIPIYPSLAEGTSDRWARGEVRAHLDALRP